MLSEIPGRWETTVREWFAINKELLRADLDPADEYVLYQTLVGTWPLELQIRDREAMKAFKERIQAWRRKSLSEAKENSSWTSPDHIYEAINSEFIEAALDPDHSPAFLERLSSFVNEIAAAGAANGLVQVTLRCTVPGVPDIYQGAEFWDLSLVDPDNRRPVDYKSRSAALGAAPTVDQVVANWRDGRSKLMLLQQLLQLRAREAELFARGDYAPLPVEGPRKDHVVAFARTLGSSCTLVLAARCIAEPLLNGARLAPPREWWEGTRVIVPAAMNGSTAQSLFDGGTFVRLSDAMRIADILTDLPVGVLSTDEARARNFRASR